MKQKLNILFLINFLSQKSLNMENKKPLTKQVQSIRQATSIKSIIQKTTPKINNLNKISRKLINMPRKNPCDRYIHVNRKCICIDNCQCPIIPPFITF